MKYLPFFLSFLLFTLFIEAGNDRAIYRKNHANENKVALVIGNSAYTNFSPLKNTIHDAKDMKEVLKAKGFDVLYLEDGDLRSMKKIVRQFSHKLRQGGVGLFYYAGHGLEVEGKNYLVPTKAEIPDRLEVEYEALAVNMIIDRMEDSHNRLNIVVLDACRNDPFNKGRDIGNGGLAQINNAKGMYIAFATAPGEIASDGDSGRNGLFTKHLIKNIGQTNLTLNEVFSQTRASVYKESNQKQIPWTSSSVIGKFYFQLAKTNGSSTPSTSVVSSSGMSDADRSELLQLRLDRKQRKDAKELVELVELEQLRKEKLKRETLVQNNKDKDKKSKKEGITIIGDKMWQDTKDVTTRMEWTQAIRYCSNLKLDKYSDWRLPSIKELEGLYSQKNKLIHMKPVGYWTTSDDKLYNYLAYYVYFKNGNTGLDNKKVGNYVRCVREKK